MDDYDDESADWPPRRKFVRPQGLLMGWFTRRLPRQPANHTRLELTWSDVRERTTKRTVLTSIGMLAAVVVGVTILFNVAFLHLTLIGTIMGIARVIMHHDLSQGDFVTSSSSTSTEGFGLPLWIKVGVTLAGAWLVYTFLKSLPRMALFEEQIFRQGSENWTWSERIRASFLFGFAHISNLVYSIATMFALSLGGLIFTAYYLQSYEETEDHAEATLEVATLHCVYNAFALVLASLAILYLIWT